MYYIFAGVSLILGFATLKDERAKSLSLSSIIIVFVTFIFKIIHTLIINGSLPDWLIRGLV